MLPFSFINPILRGETTGVIETGSNSVTLKMQTLFIKSVGSSARLVNGKKFFFCKITFMNLLLIKLK